MQSKMDPQMAMVNEAEESLSDIEDIMLERKEAE